MAVSNDDYISIRRLVEKYADAVQRRDAPDWASCWAEDGVWDLGPGRQVKGRDTIVGMWKQAMGGFPMAIQLIHGGVVEQVEGNTATARWYLTELLQTPDGGKRLGAGVYRDSYVKDATGTWLFQLRRYSLLYNGAPDLSGQAMPYPTD